MNAASKRWLIVALLLALILGALFAQNAGTLPASPPPDKKPEASSPDILGVIPSPTRAIALLQQQIESVLQRTHTPGAAVAIIRRDGPEWVAGLGLADVATHRPVTPDTLFCVGSVSKVFVSLAILKLKQEGKLDLQDTLKTRAPEVIFANPWEQTDPVRIVHLLEHTSGWDDFSMREFAYSPPVEGSLLEGLAFNPKTRTSRWKPGTRFSYSNAGPPAAAYVVEKVTGQRFEDYVRENWFAPLGMQTASFFCPPEIQKRLTTLYEADGKTVCPYRFLAQRPAGSLNASVEEMAHVVQFLLNRGAFGGAQLLPSAAIDRMEHATSTYGAGAGLATGYGLGNYTTLLDGFVYHGHNGSRPGVLTEMKYLPDAGIGYVFMINTKNASTFSGISRLLCAYVELSATAPDKSPKGAVSAAIGREFDGWYEPVSSRFEFVQCWERLIGVSRLTLHATDLTWKPLLGGKDNYLAVTDHLFRRASSPIPVLALIANHSEGTLLQISERPGGGGTAGQTFRRIPSWWVTGEVVVGIITPTLMMSSLLFALVWVPRFVIGRMRGVGYLSVRALPLLGTLPVATLVALACARGDAVDHLVGWLAPSSPRFFWLVAVNGGFALAGLVQALRFRREMPGRIVWWHSFAASAAIAAASVYLGYWGVFDLRTWG